MHRRISLFLKRAAIVCLAAVAAFGCNRKPAGGPGGAGAKGPGAGPPPEVSVVPVMRESLTLTTELPGRVEAVRVAEVRARVPGILQKRLFEEGADVKAGEVLLQIDPAPLQATLSSAKASLAKAEASVRQTQAKAERFKALVQYNAVSKQDYDDAVASALQGEAEVLSAKAAVETATLNLGYATVTAPITGRIGKAKVTEGALVGQNEATPLATIQQMDPVYFDFTQSTTEVLKLRRAMEKGKLKSFAPGQAKVTLVLEDGTIYPHAGKLLFSDISVDPTTGMITLRAQIPNPDHMLLPGMFARGQLEQAVDKDALTVPQRAVMRGPNGIATVMLVNAENRVEPRVIQTESAYQDKWVISGRINEGDRVIMEGIMKATPGELVTPVPFMAPERSTAAVSANSTR